MEFYWSKLFDLPRVEVIQFIMWGGNSKFLRRSPPGDIVFPFYFLAIYMYAHLGILTGIKKPLNTDLKQKDKKVVRYNVYQKGKNQHLELYAL